MCSYNNNILVSIPSHRYVLMNRSILCNCDIKAESNFLLELLAACDNSKTKPDLVMHFTVNLAFVNYFDEMIESLGVPILRNWTTKEHVLPFSVESFEINASLLNASKMLKDFVNQYKNKMKILELQEHIDEERTKQSSKFGSFLNSFLADILLFSATLVTIIIMLVVIYMVCRQSKLKNLVANIALQCVKGIEAADPRYQDIHCMCKMQWYAIGMLLIILLGMIYLVTNKIRSLICLEDVSNVTKVKLFTSNMWLYLPINLCEVGGSIHLFKIRGR